MIKWAGWLITFYGVAHTLGALTVEKAARYAGTWFSGGLRHEDFKAMSAANSAYWFSLGSFGIPLILVGLMVLWLDRRHITPPSNATTRTNAASTHGVIRPLDSWYLYPPSALHASKALYTCSSRSSCRTLASGSANRSSKRTASSSGARRPFA